MSMFNHVLNALERAEEDLVDVIKTRASATTIPARYQQTLGAVRKAIHIMEDAGFESDYPFFEEEEA